MNYEEQKTIQDIGLIQQSDSGQMSNFDRTPSQHDKSIGTGMSDNNQLQSKNEQVEQRRNGNTNEQGALLLPSNNSSSCIRYFSMFTGVGGFELGLSRSNRNVRYSSQEENLSNSEGNKSISERQQEGFDNSTDNGEIKSSKNTGGALFQNGQEQGNSIPRDLEQIKGYTKFGQSLRQTSSGILSEGNGIRDDSQSMELGKDRTNIKQFECIGFSEIDKYANQLLANKFLGIKNYGDATKIEPSELPDFDMLCGGFPCQSFSIAGKRRGFEDTRGTMFFHIARILKIKRPKLVFLENVKGLLNHDKGKTFSVIIQTLEELGYNVQWMVLNSKFFGVPQNRERVFIIGSLRGEPRPEILPFRESNPNFNEQNAQRDNTAHCLQVGDKARGSYVREQIAEGSQGYRVYGTEGTSVTLAGQAGGIGAKTGLYAISPTIRTAQKQVSHNKPSWEIINDGLKIRRLTPVECERLQGFPDNWTSGFSDTQRYKMMGNAVTVNVIKAIAGKIA